MDLQALKKFCDIHKRQELWSFVESCIFRYWAALYHLSNIRDKLERAREDGRSRIEDVLKLEKELLFEVDALMLSLNSMFAIVAQVINEGLLVEKLHVTDVDLKEVSTSGDLPADLREELRLMMGDTFYQRITCYSNTSKHIRAVRGQLSIDFRPETPEADYKINEFRLKQPLRLDYDKIEACWRFASGKIERLLELVDVTLRSRG